jgi:indole-3-glycerol phosphate synthase
MQKFVDAKAAEIRCLLENREGLLRSKVHRKWSRPGFLEALRRGRDLRGIGLVCEYKRASPSQGDIELGIGPKEAALAYARADCISVLTEESLFKGSLDFLRQMGGPLPLLRKDFILHPLQVEETARTPASAILLIVRLTPSRAEVRSLVTLATGLGLEPVVEVFDEKELRLAREVGARLIQVNARDLTTMHLDLDASLQLIKDNPPTDGELWIAASGVSDAADLRRFRDAGYGAALVGTTLMRGGRPKERLDVLIDGMGVGA